MTQRLFLLNGLAILAVVCNHSAHAGFLALFWWTDRYMPGVTVPNYDQFGTISYYALIVITKLTPFAIPAFLFVSGFFIAYTARGSQSALSWKVVRTRIVNLLIPYFIWSLVYFILDFFESCLNVCTVESLDTYLVKLATGGAVTTFWYVPLICQFYLLSPFLLRLARTRPRLLLGIGLCTLLGTLLVTYLGLLGVDVPPVIRNLFTSFWFPRDMIYFILGIIAGLHLPQFSRWLVQVKYRLLVTVVVAATLTLVEAELIFRYTGEVYYLGHIRGGYFTIPMTVYVISFILTVLAFKEVQIPFSKMLLQLGRRSYGIFLMHRTVLNYFTPRAVYHLAPFILGYQILYQPVLIVSAIGLPYLFMSFVARSRFRGAYRYLFG